MPIRKKFLFHFIRRFLYILLVNFGTNGLPRRWTLHKDLFIKKRRVWLNVVFSLSISRKSMCPFCSEQQLVQRTVYRISWCLETFIGLNDFQMLDEEELSSSCLPQAEEQQEQLGLWRAADRGQLDRVRQLVEQVGQLQGSETVWFPWGESLCAAETGIITLIWP